MRMLGALQRHRQAEIMDQPDLDAQRHRRALAGLARINRISGSAQILWPAVRDLCGHAPGTPLRVLDVATGAGDVPIALWQKAKRAGLPVSIAGCDRSETALDYARGWANAARADVSFFTADVFHDPLPNDYDVVTCSLFLHHWDEAGAIELLRQMAQAARRLVLVNDLRRSRVGWWLARLGTQFLTRSDVVHVDAPLSVQAAFTMEEARQLAVRAGLEGATVVPRWPWRFLMSWWKPLK